MAVTAYRAVVPAPCDRWGAGRVCSRTAPHPRDVRSGAAYGTDRYGTYNHETMRKPVVLITGAGGEIGHALVARFAERDAAIITLDVNPLERDAGAARSCASSPVRSPTRACSSGCWRSSRSTASSTSRRCCRRAPSSRRSTAHHVNVEGTLNLLEFAQQAGRVARPAGHVRLPVVDRHLRPAGSSRPRRAPARVREDEYPHPTTMYGCNKLYCEELGRYYARHYKQLSVDVTPRVDFRAVRFPGPDFGDDACRRAAPRTTRRR